MTSAPLNLDVTRIGRLPHLLWRGSLYVRIIVLCVVLFGCMIALMGIITRHLFLEAVSEMEEQTDTITKSISLLIQETPSIALGELSNKLMDLHQGVNIELQPYQGEVNDSAFSIERSKKGEVTRVARVPMRNGDRQIMLTLSITIVPQTEILRAFRNRSVEVLIAVFVITLGLLVYFIIKAFRPLNQLSKSCAAISSGDLQTVSTRGATGEVRALEETFNHMVLALREKQVMEGKLRHAERLSALGNLAAGVAHDVRNPLNSIKLLSSHAQDMLQTGGTEPAAKSLQIICNEVDRLEAIVSGFLSLAKESQLHAEPTRADDLLRECVQLLKNDADQRGVTIHAAYGAPDILLMLDPRQWGRAIMNVLMNAMEALPEGGLVQVHSRADFVTYEIDLIDNGPGLPEDVRKHLFEPYFTTKPDGTGLGLSITRGIVEAHGGVIELMNVNEHGCRVRIRLPLQKARVE